jgi:hypothetical protein
VTLLLTQATATLVAAGLAAFASLVSLVVQIRSARSLDKRQTSRKAREDAYYGFLDALNAMEACVAYASVALNRHSTLYRATGLGHGPAPHVPIEVFDDEQKAVADELLDTASEVMLVGSKKAGRLAKEIKPPVVRVRHSRDAFRDDGQASRELYGLMNSLPKTREKFKKVLRSDLDLD